MPEGLTLNVGLINNNTCPSVGGDALRMEGIPD
jgi:hypothetical protein